MALVTGALVAAAPSARAEPAANLRLPRAGLELADSQADEWQVIDGAEVGRPGADALVSTATVVKTRYAVTVEPGACHGDSGLSAVRELPTAEAAGLFPPALGTVWVGEQVTSDVALWTAWVCASTAGREDRIAIVAPPGQREPPLGDEQPSLFAIVARVATAYGVDASAAPAEPQETIEAQRGTASPRRRIGQVAAYAGALAMSPPGGRQLGGLIGLQVRLADLGDLVINGLAFDLEVGVGEDGPFGEGRAALGGAFGPLDVVAGFAVVHLPHASPIEGYAQVALTLPVANHRRSALVVAGLGSLGLQKRTRAQLDLQWYSGRGHVGLRGMWFGAGDGSEGTEVVSFGAVMLTLGAGLIVLD